MEKEVSRYTCLSYSDSVHSTFMKQTSHPRHLQAMANTSWLIHKALIIMSILFIVKEIPNVPAAPRRLCNTG